MRLAIIAIGSRGDVEPYVALGAGLQRAGHHVRVVTTIDFADYVAAYGLEVWPVLFDVQAAAREQRTSTSLESGKLVTSFRRLAQIARRGATLAAEKALAASNDVDMILSGVSGLFLAWSIAQKRALPLIQAYNVPLTPTAAFAGALVPWMSFSPRTMSHRLSHWLTRQAVWLASRASGDAARQSVLGLPAAPRFFPLGEAVLQRGPVLYGFSPAVIDKPDDWDARTHVTGYWFSDEPTTWSPAPELLAFLAAGPAPVYIGFGSMSTNSPETTTRLVLDAVMAAGVRAIVHTGWAGLGGAAALPPSVHVVDWVPHRWLFARTVAVVHHGGAGTTAAALRAGVPSIVIPFHGDQPFWARRVAALGVGPAPVPRKHLTSALLSRALIEATTNPAMKSCAAELGRRVRAENGVARAVALIEEFASGLP